MKYVLTKSFKRDIINLSSNLYELLRGFALPYFLVKFIISLNLGIVNKILHKFRDFVLSHNLFVSFLFKNNKNRPEGRLKGLYYVDIS